MECLYCDGVLVQKDGGYLTCSNEDCGSEFDKCSDCSELIDAGEVYCDDCQNTEPSEG